MDIHPNPAPTDARIWPILWPLVAFKLGLHLCVNTWFGYEIFRDELYYLACADHLAWGYVDHPPLSVGLLAATRAVLGDSLFALRLLPALAGAGVVLLTGLMARELGGGRLAVALAAVAAIVCGETLAASSIWSMNIFDSLLMAVAALVFARISRTEQPRYWIWLGVTLGLGLLNKVGVLWVGAGMFGALVLTPERRWLATRWPWLAGAIAFAMLTPYVIWNASHDWAHLEFIENAVTGKYAGLSAWTFISGLVVNQNPTTFLLWGSGLVWLLFARDDDGVRPLGILWVVACGVLLVNGHSKASYMASLSTVVFAAGGVAWERFLPRRRLVRLAALGLVSCGIGLAPLATPLLPVATYVRYADALGVSPGTDEGHELAELPQFFADMFGWQAKAAAVAEVFHALPPEDRQRASILAHNYGRSGAIDYYADAYDLPRAIGTHNNYWIWGPRDATEAVMIVLGGEIEDLERRFESVELAGRAPCKHCIPYERDVPIHVCRGLLLPMSELWPLTKHYD